MQANRPIVLSIAGFDPSGGAGVLADIKTFEQLKVQGMAVLTANTIQTENTFVRMEWLPMDFIVESINTLFLNYSISIVKIGVVKDFQFLKSIVETIKKHSEKTFIVWDPVLESSSGFVFFANNDLDKLPEIAKKIDLITPNYEEYLKMRTTFESNIFKNILIKGGHRKDKLGTDILRQNDKEIELLPKVEFVHEKHGSGCVLSAAIATYLALGQSLEEACTNGKQYIEKFLNSHPALLGYHNDI